MNAKSDDNSLAKGLAFVVGVLISLAIMKAFVFPPADGSTDTDKASASVSVSASAKPVTATATPAQSVSASATVVSTPVPSATPSKPVSNQLTSNYSQYDTFYMIKLRGEMLGDVPLNCVFYDGHKEMVMTCDWVGYHKAVDEMNAANATVTPSVAPSSSN